MRRSHPDHIPGWRRRRYGRKTEEEQRQWLDAARKSMQVALQRSREADESGAPAEEVQRIKRRMQKSLEVYNYLQAKVGTASTAVDDVQLEMLRI